MEKNNMKVEIKALLENVAITRVAISSFLTTIDIALDDLMDIKTALSEAVTNAIEHAYDENKDGNVIVRAYIFEEDVNVIKLEIEDKGIGIEDISLATTPTYTSKPELEHAGMGFTIMETFMDEILIDSLKDIGTKITLIKKIKKRRSASV